MAGSKRDQRRREARRRHASRRSDDQRRGDGRPSEARTRDDQIDRPGQNQHGLFGRPLEEAHDGGAGRPQHDLASVPLPPRRLGDLGPPLGPAPSNGLAGNLSREECHRAVDRAFAQAPPGSTAKLLQQMDHPAFERRVPSLQNMKPAPRNKPLRQDALPTCGLCGREGHCIDICIKAGRSGFVEGCPRCNSADHLVDKHIHSMTATERFRYLVQNRAGLPPLASRLVGWPELVRGNPPLASSSYPWTREFSSVFWRNRRNARLADEFNYTTRRPELPVDPRTMNRDTVIAWAWNDPESEKFKSASQIRQNRDAPNPTGEEHWLLQEEVEEEGPSGEGCSFFDEFDIDHYM
ncbi:uncharacterized protein E0L32_010647 [Thyridium curvatum]|uniref:Uncharacterized protein n=1 Tax=Thyridium curvatum TaxID=1093900 RepID=A0A507ARY9_9PEZI|nr:uncharacterized protein E0L32_010647 [Thyridium curvatum]TPX07649.1 hypothetical protein E0L32_010647 [Thyridium curvatum]